MKAIILGVVLFGLLIWILKEHRDSIKHREGKKDLNLSGNQWIEVLERSIKESWQVGLFYGFFFGIVLILLFQSLKIW